MVIVNSKFVGALFEKKFHVYHEGNNYFFDIFWLLLSPTVYRTEYNGLKATTQITKDELNYSKYIGIYLSYYRILKVLKLENSFEFFKSFDGDGSTDVIWFRVRDEYVKESFKPSISSRTKWPTKQRSVILLIGKDVIADTILIEIIDDTIECLCNVGSR